MKNFFPLLLLAVAFSTLYACKKSSSSPASSLTCTIDGTTISFNTNLAAIKTLDSASGVTYINIIGATSNYDTANGFTLEIDNYAGQFLSGGIQPIGAGPYTLYSTTGFDIRGEYFPSLAVSDTLWDAGNTATSYADQTDFFNITVSSINNTTISGTFSGKLYYNTGTGVDGATYKTITNGFFNVAFRN